MFCALKSECESGGGEGWNYLQDSVKAGHKNTFSDKWLCRATNIVPFLS